MCGSGGVGIAIAPELQPLIPNFAQSVSYNGRQRRGCRGGVGHGSRGAAHWRMIEIDMTGHVSIIKQNLYPSLN
eukprot:5893571-Prymnesium_polylepis.1